MNGDDVLTALLEQLATARRLAWRLCTMFFGEGLLDDSSLDQLATGLHERKLDVAWAIETIVRSRLFFADGNLRSRVLGPVEFIVGALHALTLDSPPPSTLLLAEWASRMGQELLAPPNVGGWREGRAWLRSRSLVARANFAAALADGSLWNPPALITWDRHVLLDAENSDLSATLSSLVELFFGEAVPPVVDDIVAAARAKPAADQLPEAIAALLSHPESQLA